MRISEYKLLFLLWMICCGHSCLQAQKIRVGSKFSNTLHRRLLNPTIELSKTKDYGIEFVSPEQADVIIVDTPFQNALPEHVPLILIYWKDQSSLPFSTLAYLKHPRIKAFFGNTILYPSYLYLAAHVGDCYHGKLINDVAHLFPVQRYLGNVSMNDLNKVKCVPWSPLRSVLGRESLGHYQIDFEKERPYDVCFIGAERWDWGGVPPEMRALYAWHRKHAIQEIENLPHIKKFLKITKPRSTPPDPDYLSHLRSSKIVISPWGFGEWCWRDYEAIFSGAVLIKPDSSFVKALPPIYQNDITYVACKRDFSDLQEKVTHILANYGDYMPLRKRAYAMCVQFKRNAFMENFAAEIRAVLSSI